MGRLVKSKQHKTAVKQKNNNHYYNTKTKITRQLRRKIEKAELQYTLTQNDLDNYQIHWVNHFTQFRWNYNGCFREDIFKSDLNSQTIKINNLIRQINKKLTKEYHLPLQPLKERSLKSLQSYSEKYFTFLMHKRLIDRAIWFFEKDKFGMWHLHCLLNVVNQDANIEVIKDYWLLSEHPYLEPIKNLKGSLIYMTKTVSKFHFNLKKNIENFYFLGDFSNKKNPLRLNTATQMQQSCKLLHKGYL